jgi:hypothetical protein
MSFAEDRLHGAGRCSSAGFAGAILARGEVRKGGDAPLRASLKRISSHVTALVFPILEEV